MIGVVSVESRITLLDIVELLRSRVALLDIVELVNKLRSKIEKHRDLLQSNEALTRYALIDPLLRALGWDTEDPDQVEPESSTPTTDNDRADYVLKINGEKVAVVEAKKLGTRWDSGVVGKVLYYATTIGAKFAVITDGDKWEIYDATKAVELSKKLILSWQITDKNSPSEDIALKALAIANLGNPKALGTPGHKPILLPRETEKTEEMGKAKSKTGESKTIEGPITSKLAEDLILQILAEANRPMGRKEILNEVKNRVELKESDLEILESGGTRWEKIVQGTITRLSNKGYIKKAGKNSYEITDEGRKKLNKS